MNFRLVAAHCMPLRLSCHAMAARACKLFAALTALAFFSMPAFAQLNDTGQTLCYTTGNIGTACNEASTGDTSALPGQDGRYGRDAAQAAGAMPPKTGGGAAGFDFTALDSNGNEVSPSTAHDCVKDNVTGLLWSTEALGPMAQTAAMTADNGYVRCGYNTGWRLPTRRELLSIVHNGRATSPAIDPDYFPGTQSYAYWTQDIFAFSYPASAYAWYVTFDTGTTSTWDKTYASSFRARLVRSGQ